MTTRNTYNWKTSLSVRLFTNNGNICLHILVCRLTTWLECHSGQILVRYEEASKAESAHITLSVLHSRLADTIKALKATLCVTDQRPSFQNPPCWLLLIRCNKWYLDFIIITKRNLCAKLGIERKPGSEEGKRVTCFFNVCVSLYGFWSGQGFEIRNLRLCRTCLSDLPQQVKISSLPLILTQINIKLNTRPCSVNFMWLRMIGFLLHHTARIKEHETPMRVPVSQWNLFPISLYV